MSTNKENEEKELTDEEKKAKAEGEEGLSEDELEGVSGGTGVARAVPAAGAIPKKVGTAIGGAAGGVGAGAYHIKTGPVFPKGNNSMPGGGQQQGG